MSVFKSTFEELIQSLRTRLQEAEARETGLPARQETCIRICEDSLLKLRQWVTTNAFPDRDCEIYFFKRVKPEIMSRFLYYQKVHRLHTGYYNGCGLLEKERLETELHNIKRFFNDNREYYAYYRNGYTHHDELYFIRGQYDWKLCPAGHPFDSVFATSFDGMLAELMAHELLIKYIDGMLNPTVKLVDPAPANTVLRAHHGSLRCSVSSTDVVELGYALYAIGFFDHGKATIKDIMKLLSGVSQMDLQHHSHTFFQIRERKGNPAKFLDELKAAFLRYIDQLE